jgi:hypothetical protein
MGRIVNFENVEMSSMLFLMTLEKTDSGSSYLHTSTRSLCNALHICHATYWTLRKEARRNFVLHVSSHKGTHRRVLTYASGVTTQTLSVY